MAATVEHDIDTLVAEMHARMSSGQADSTGCAYARYSTDFQHSIIDQLRGVFESAIQLGIFIPRAFVFYDTAITGKKSNRRGLNAVKHVLAKKSAKTLLVFTTNRFYRKSYNCSKFIEEEIVEQGLRCVFVRSGIDTGLDDKWRLPLQIQGLVDELGTSQYAPNIRAAHESLFAKGWVVTTLPYGYMGEDIAGPLTKRHLTRQMIAIDPELAHWVKKIFHWFVVEGRILARILEELNDQNVPPGPKSDGTFWTPQALHYLLTNSAYRGLWTYGKGESVWQSKKDYSKRVLRPTPLCEAQFENLRLVSDEIWFKAQEILASSPQRNAGRKPKDGDQATRPRILNGFLKCPTHRCPLKVGGAYGRWMFCPKCYALPKSKRPLYSYLRRDLTLRRICRAIADAIRADDTLVSDLIARCLTAAAEVQKDDDSRKDLTTLTTDAEKLTRTIIFTQSNPGETEHDLEESKSQLKMLRGKRANVRAEIARLTSTRERALRVPTEAEIRTWIDGLAATLEAAASGDDADAGILRNIIELLTGGKIVVEQMGDRKPRCGWHRVRFELGLVEIGSSHFDLVQPANGSKREIVVDIRADPEARIAERHAEPAFVLYGQGMLVTAIAHRLGIERHQAAEAICIAHEHRDLPRPDDGRVRRGRVSDKFLKPPLFQEIAEEAKRLLDEGSLIEVIAERLRCNRDTVQAALKYWYSQRGELMPDMRNRRKTLAIKNRSKSPV